MSSYGVMSLFPILLILILAVTTKRTLLALFAGSVLGSILLAKSDFVNSWIGYLNIVLADETFQWIVLVIVLFGALIALFEKSHAVTDFAKWVERFVDTRKKSLFLTYILGILIFLDDYLNNLAVGTTMKKLTDKFGVSRTMLGYIVNTTAAPVCVLIPLSTWAVFFGGLLEAQGVTVNGTGMGAYIQAIPFIFYGWFAIIIIPLVILGIVPLFGPMKKFELAAKAKGEIFPNGDDIYGEMANEEEISNQKDAAEVERKRPHPFNFLIPLIVMIAATIYFDINVQLGTLCGLISIFVIYIPQKTMKLKEMLDAVFDGVSGMFFVLVLTCFAFMVQKMNIDLQLADYVIGLTKPIMSGAFLPAAVFLVCAVYAYATGCFWDMAAIITPIVIPLAIAMGANPILAAAALFSGAAFGSNTCLYGDAMILASRSVGVQPVHLMLAILPYAAIGGIISFIMYIITGMIMY